MKNLFANLFSRKSTSSSSTGAVKFQPPGREIRRKYGFPPKIQDFFGEISTADDDPGWDYRLWVEEWSEPYLGTEQFRSLEHRFASTVGVTGVAHMDREVFLIASRLNAADLRDLLWQHFVEAAKSGVAQDV
jgi:hypothetical protein